MATKTIKASRKNSAAKNVVPAPSSRNKKGAGKSISKEQELFLQLLSNYPDGAVSIVDRNFNFVITGGELHKRLAADPSDLIGFEIYPKFPQKLRDVIKTELKEVFEGKKLTEFELPYPLKGELYIMNAFPLREKNGTINYAGVIIRNISDLKIAKEEVKRTARKAIELVELKSRFITMASHEFRTPLSTVLTSASLLKKYTAAGKQENLEKHINRISSSAHLLNELLNDFLSVEEIERGEVAVNLTTLSIKDHVNWCINQLAESQKKEHPVTYIHEGEEQIVSDPTLLSHIITNLLSNAIKFSAESSPIEIRTGWINKRLAITIKDQGIGIPKEYREHLFERFYRASNALNIQGTGLGLHIVSKYVQLLKGTIKYESELQEGTSFVVTF